MDISSIQSHAAHAAKFSRAKDSDEVQPGASAAAKGQAEAHRSDRASFRAGPKESSELTAAKTALRNVDTLDDSRRAEIQARLKTGFYTRADVLESVSAKMAEALTPNQGASND